jgi:hypothetical protein
MEDYLPYLDVYDEALAPPVDDFGGGFALPEAIPQQRTAEDRERELLALLAQVPSAEPEERPTRQRRQQRIINRSASLGVIDPLTGKFTRIEDTFLYHPDMNTFRSPQEQRALRDWFPDLDWGYRRGKLVPFSSI